MKYLLCAINAKFIHSNPAVYSLREYAMSQDIPGAVYVIREFTINQYVDDILADLYEEGMDVLILSCYLWNARHVMEIAAEYRKIDPLVQIWVGGPEVSYDGADLLRRQPAIDLVMQGEGEETFAGLAASYESGDHALDHTMLRGIVYRKGCEIVDRGLARVEDLDQLPFLYEEEYEKDNLARFENRIIYYESSRGCPFHCSYCLSSVGEKVRFRSLSLVYRELDVFLQASVRQVKFVDRTFNCRPDHAMGIWRYLRDHDNGVTNFHFEIAGDLISEEMLALFATMRPGLIQLEVGLQSTYDPTLTEINRRTDRDRLFLNFHQILQMGNIHQHLDLIAGLPYETYDQFKESFSRAFICLPDALQLGFLKVLKGTRMRENAPAYGLVFREMAPYEVVRTRWMDYGSLVRLKRISYMLDTWYNSDQYHFTLKYAIPYYETPFTFFEQFADWYHDRAYDRISHSRMDKYRILHDFLLEHRELAEEREVLEDIMVYDWYRKEKSRKRPEFARDPGPYRKDYKSWYRDLSRVSAQVSEPRERGSQVSEPRERGSQAAEPRNRGSQAAEPRNRGSQAAEPRNREFRVAEPRVSAPKVHIEHFEIDMELFFRCGEILPCSCFGLFDYEDVHSLTRAARFLQWEEGEEIPENPGFNDGNYY